MKKLNFILLLGLVFLLMLSVNFGRFSESLQVDEIITEEVNDINTKITNKSELNSFLDPNTAIELDIVTNFAENNSLTDYSFSTLTNSLHIDNSNNVTLRNLNLVNNNESYSLKITNSYNVTIENFVINSPIEITGDFTAVDILNSPNVTLSDVFIYNMNAAQENINRGVRLDTSSNATLNGIYYYNTFLTGMFVELRGIEIINSEDVVVNDPYFDDLYTYGNITLLYLESSNRVQINRLYSYNINSQKNFTRLIETINSPDIIIVNQTSYYTYGFAGLFLASFENSPNLSFNNNYIFYSVSTDGQTRGISLDSSSNSNITGLSLVTLQSWESKIVGIEIDSSNNINVIGSTFQSLTSFADGFDFNNEKSIFGIFVFNSPGILVNSTNFFTFDGNVNIYGIYILDSSNSNLVLNNLYFFDGKTVYVVYFKNSGFAMISKNNIISHVGLKSFGIFGINTQLLILDNYISSIIASTFGGSIDLTTATNSIINNNTLIFGISYSLFFEFSIIRIKDSLSVNIFNNLVTSSFSKFFDMNGIFLSNVNSSFIHFNKILNSYSEITSFAGILIEDSNSILAFNNTMINLYSLSTPSTILPDLDLDPAGYGFILLNADSVSIYNNSLSSVDQWLIFDQTSDNLISISNSINDFEDDLMSFSRPQDILFNVDENGPNKVIVWSATTNPTESASNYSIFKDGLLLSSGNWISGIDITFQLANLTFGSHIYEIQLVQKSGFTTSDLVIVEAVELTKPIITSTPENTRIAEGASRNLIWTISENNPDTYSILRNGTEIAFGAYSKSENITYSLQLTPLGNYNFTIVVRDTSNNIASDSVIVTIVEPQDLTLSSAPYSLEYIEGETGNFVNFIVAGVSGGNYLVSYNGISVGSGKWFPAALTSFNIDDLLVGQYLYEFLVVDDDANSISFEVIIIVISPPQTPTTTEDGFNIIEFTTLIQNLQNVKLDRSDAIPLLAAAFGGGIIFIPGSRYIRKKAAEANVSNITKRKSNKKKNK